jgi:hypothetical protein
LLLYIFVETDTHISLKFPSIEHRIAFVNTSIPRSAGLVFSSTLGDQMDIQPVNYRRSHRNSFMCIFFCLVLPSSSLHKNRILLHSQLMSVKYDRIALKCWIMISESMSKRMDGCLMEVPSQDSPGGTEGNHGKPKSR